MSFFGKLQETHRDKTRDYLCALLQSIGIDARMAERGRPEEKTIRFSTQIWGAASLGLVEIHGGSIRWVNVARVTSWSGSGDVSSRMKYRNIYLVPDSSVYAEGDKWAKFYKVKRPPFIGRVVGFRWVGMPSDLINQLNCDLLLNHSLTRLKKEIHIHSHLDYVAETGYWVIVPESDPTDWFQLESDARTCWDCYNTIARYLLESGGK